MHHVISERAKVLRGAREGLLAEMGESQALAALMAAAAVGLRGGDARRSMSAVRRSRAASRWASVCASGTLRREQIKQRDVQLFEARLKRLLGDTDASSKEI